MLLPWAAVAVLWRNVPGAGRAASPPPAAEAVSGKAGPWGNLECVPIQIAPPPEFVPEISLPDADWKWVFPGMSAPAVEAFLAECGLSGSARDSLIATAVLDSASGGCALKPPADAVRSLPMEARQKIYRKLGQFESNPDQANACRILTAEFDERLKSLAVPDGVKSLIRQTSYQNGRFWFFADLRLAMPMVPLAAERMELVCSLSQASTMLIRLRVNKDSDIRALASYWGAGGRSKDIEPLLESLARNPGGQTIDINHLLPAFPRRRIYTFPRPSNDPIELQRDCHWAAFNFFEETPSDRYAGPAHLQETLDKNYTEIHGKPMLGDLTLLIASDSTLWHSAVYIADDIVFTKMGARAATPYIFMRLADMMDYYPCEKPLKAHYYRRNDLVSP
jgi:hypothetical protein